MRCKFVRFFACVSILLLACSVAAQSRSEPVGAAFEAASVKRNQSGGRTTRIVEPGRITYLNITLGEFIAMAYGVNRYQISGPEWILNSGSSDRYDLIATAGTAAPIAEVKRMLAPLLAERFHLVIHRETKDSPVFALLVAKGGPKLGKASNGGDASMAPDGEGGFSFKNWSMASLADWLTYLPSVGRLVIDRSGLAGTYSFRANFFGFGKGIEAGEMKAQMSSGDAADAVFTALREQLGLKLEAQKAPVEMIVIDHADKVPTEN